MYKLFNVLSAFIRQFCLPNPYVMYFESSAYADIFNIIVGGYILHLLSFLLTSSIYEKGIHPSWIGSILYCVNYIFNTILFSFLCYNFGNLDLAYILIVAFIINFMIWMVTKRLKIRFYSTIY